MTIRRLWIIVPVILCLTAVLVISAFVFRTLNVENPSVVCPDGSVVELMGVTYGKTHHNPMNGPWAKLLQIVPPSIQQRWNMPGSQVRTTKEDTIMVWLQWKGRASAWHGNKKIVDNNGFASELSHWGHSGSSTTANGKIHWLGLEVDVYPRRSPSFKLRLSDWDQNTEAEFEIQNPFLIDTEPFSGDPLPISTRVDDMQFTLVALNMLDPVRPPKRSQVHFGSHDVRAIFEIHDQGKISEDWQPVNIWLEDATGNKAKNHSWSNQEKDGKASITFDSGLFPGEAWQIRTQFARKSNFLPEDIWSVEIPLPNAPDYQTNLVSRVMHGKTIKIQGIADENGLLLDGSKAEPNGRRNPNEHSFEIRVEDDMPEALRLDLFEIVDNQGRSVKTGGKSWGGGHYRYTIKLEEDATRLTVNLAVHSSKYAEFVAEPSVIAAEDPKN